MSESKHEAKTWAAALGRVPSGLFVITARHGKQETGMLASWVQQCSFQPPQITVAFSKERWVLEWFTEGFPFVVNVLGEGQKSILSHFGKGFAPGEPAFDRLEVRHSQDTAPVLLACHAYLDCRVVTRYDAGDHALVLGHVLAGEVLHEGKPATHHRKSGDRY